MNLLCWYNLGCQDWKFQRAQIKTNVKKNEKRYKCSTEKIDFSWFFADFNVEYYDTHHMPYDHFVVSTIHEQWWVQKSVASSNWHVQRQNDDGNISNSGYHIESFNRFTAYNTHIARLTHQTQTHTHIQLRVALMHIATTDRLTDFTHLRRGKARKKTQMDKTKNHS